MAQKFRLLPEQIIGYLNFFSFFFIFFFVGISFDLLNDCYLELSILERKLRFNIQMLSRNLDSGFR
jgi:hypothetical protein